MGIQVPTAPDGGEPLADLEAHDVHRRRDGQSGEGDER